MYTKINLGCGHQRKPGFIGVDMREPADVICRVGVEPLPFEDGSVDNIFSDNLFEHFDNDEFLFAFNDCHRLLKDGGELEIIVPDAKNFFEGAFGDPTHKRFMVWPRSFIYMQEGHNTYRNYGRHYGFLPWRIDYDRSATDNKFIHVYMYKV